MYDDDNDHVLYVQYAQGRMLCHKIQLAVYVTGVDALEIGVIFCLYSSSGSSYILWMEERRLLLI